MDPVLGARIGDCWTAGCFSDSACLRFRLPSSGSRNRVRPRRECDILGLSEDEIRLYLNSIHEAISFIALSFVGYTIRWTLSFLSVALNDSAHAPTQSRPRTPHRGTNPVTLEVIQELLGRVLAPPVGVKDRHTLLDRASPDRHVNGLAHQGGVHVVGHRVTHGLLGAAVQTCRQIDKPSPRPDVGGAPPACGGMSPHSFLPGSSVAGVPSEQVRALVQVLGRHGGSDLCPWLRGLQPQVPHDGADRGTVRTDPTPLQDHLDSPVTVGALTSAQKCP